MNNALSQRDCRLHAGQNQCSAKHIRAGLRYSEPKSKGPFPYIQSVGASRSRSGLRSSSTSSMDYSLPRQRTFNPAFRGCQNPINGLLLKFGERAFSHAGPATWNALPDHIRTVADPVSSSKNCLNHSILVKLLTFVDFCVSLCFSIWLTFVMHL